MKSETFYTEFKISNESKIIHRIQNPKFQTFSKISALITGSQDTCVYWEGVDKPGYAYLDLRGSKSGEKTCYHKNDIFKQPFYLTIPKGQLKPGLKYKFQVNAKTGSRGSMGTSTLIITTTLGLPEEDDITIEVRSNEILSTKGVENT